MPPIVSIATTDMVSSVGNELYSPYPPHLAIEDGVQSSEEGSTSDVHSPVFEVPYTADGRLIVATIALVETNIVTLFKKSGITLTTTYMSPTLQRLSCRHPLTRGIQHNT